MLTIITNLSELKMNRKKRCRLCKKYGYTEKMLNVNNAYFCNMEEVIEYAYKNKEKGKEKKHREQKKNFQLNDRQIRTKAAQQSFNAFIRKRDGNKCISCQRVHQGQIHAGHYKSIGSSPELRFNEFNCHSQCSACNNHLSGNIGEYRRNLIDKIGLDLVEGLEKSHSPKKYTCDQLKDIELLYKQKLKDLREG